MPRDVDGAQLAVYRQIVFALDRHDAPLVAQLEVFAQPKMNRHIAKPELRLSVHG